MDYYAREYRIRSSWQVRTTAGEPFAAVRVRNLQAIVHAAQDAWGRPGKAQPLLISAEVSLRDTFDHSSAGDKVTGDTVNYGTLSKAILASLELCQQPRPDPPILFASALGGGGEGPGGGGGTSSAAGSRYSASLRGVLDAIWSGLTGLTIDGIRRRLSGDEKPFLDTSRVQSLSVTVTLPKASLMGSGVSLTATSLFGSKGPQLGGPPGAERERRTEMFGICLRLHSLRVPTLIGVNPNERLAKQVVAADIEIDKFDYAPDVYTTLEALVVKAMEESSFGTLEALGSHLGRKIMSDFKPLPGQTYSGYFGWQVKISMEKPTAVPFADAPVVEIRLGAGGPHVPSIRED